MRIFFILALFFKLGAGTSGARMLCAHLPGLTARQREMCRAAPDSMAAVGAGYRLAIAECQRRFALHRWNCTPVTSRASFGHVVVVGSREAAFTYGIASAGVAHAVAAGCARGALSGCGCLGGPRRGGWKWAGCSVDLGYGLAFARRFLDSREMEGDPRSLMNLHNNRAGRTAVRVKMGRVCKCHGVSGSCSLRTCWRALPRFGQVAEALMRRYWRARAVTAAGAGALRTRRGREAPRRADLVFLQPSPDYCEPDPAAGSLGTAGRTCNISSKGMGGCEVLCCGRGYSTQEVRRSWHCNCKFHWCCEVECDTCSRQTQVHTCN